MKTPALRYTEPGPYTTDGVTGRQLLIRQELRKIVRETTERIERSRKVLAENYDTMCRWWWLTNAAEMPVGMEQSPTAELLKKETG
ncbi:MAG TPA: hypothetical protein VN612_06110 [Acidobacteriaceae bacterium]|nr:hypothetical protein [Acidobacteriaceae bacterium]